MNDNLENMDEIADMLETLVMALNASPLTWFCAMMAAYEDGDREQYKAALKMFLATTSRITLGTAAEPLPLPL